ncbi:hypothetical protein [Chitinophaga sp. LS1]|uniref:hypothetical protein n=1 Tax=Chitinophaga sp. LS1 TaxID=3051176 RepID=UPI0039F0287B
MLPSIEVAVKIANALYVSLNYLAGNTDQLLEKNIVKNISDIQQLPQDDKAHLLALMDAFLRDHKAKKAYAHYKQKPHHCGSCL